MKIFKLDNQGRGITYKNDKIMFVSNALVNEDVEVKDIKENKKFIEATAGKITNENINRVIPKCPYYHLCGGCNIMHMNNEAQEDFKLKKVQEILKKYAGIDEEVKLIKNDKQILYRNKISLHVENGLWGYFNTATHSFKNIDVCLLASDAINKIVENHKFINLNSGEIVIRSNYESEILIAIKSSEEVIIKKELIPENVVGIVVNDKTIYKDNYFYDYINDLKFKVSYNSFFQVNNYMAGRIFDLLSGNLSGSNLLDLYCGVGTLGLSLHKNFKNIYGIEKIENAIRDAKDNALSNGIENTHYYAGDTSKILSSIDESFDVVIVDPPRSGLNDETRKLVLEINPQVIAYISCDPMTLARDLKVLKEHYDVKKVNALEMFPNTYHVETSVILERKN